MNELKMRTVTITPDMASRLLQMNIKNRPLEFNRAVRLSEAIKRGEWKLNGDTIRISETGIVLDGQHRLKAIELSGCSVQTILVEGLPDCVFNTIDTNAKSRTASDVFAIEGEKNYVALASTLVLLYKYQNFGSPYSGSIYPTSQQVELTLKNNPEIRDAINKCASKKWIRRYVVSSAAAFALYVFRIFNEEMANSFFEKLETGAGLDSDSPILLLRDRLIFEEKDKKTAISKKYKMALIFKAFKCYMNGQTLKILKVRMDGDLAEKDIFKLN